MNSGFPGGDPGFYGGSGGGRSIGNGFVENNINGGSGVYRLQQQHLGGNPGLVGYRRPDLTMIGKRSLAEFQASSHPSPQNSYFQQQQGFLGGGGGFFLRSMKQRTGGFVNNTLSPISPLSASIDLCSLSQDHPSPSSSLSTTSSARFSVPNLYHQQQLQQHRPINSANQGPIFNPGSENNSNKKVINSIQELEKHLFDEGDAENDAVSDITNNDWSLTFEDLISPTPTAITTVTAEANTISVISPSPTTSTSSCSSSKTPPPLLLAQTPQTPPIPKPTELISEAAMAIAEGKTYEIAETLSRLSQVASPTGDPEQRLAFHMLHALRYRVSLGENPPQIAELYSAEHVAAIHALYDLSPCFKFALFSSNLLILEAIASTIQENNASPKVVHIIDFDVGRGRQYVNLLRTLVERLSHTNSPLLLKITAVETETVDDEEALKRIEGVRESLTRIVSEKFSLQFNSVTRSVNELTRESIGCGPDETLIANFAFRLYRVPDESVSVENFRDELLRRVRAMNPRVVAVAEQELSANTSPFVARVSDSTGYYGALLESLELARESPEWARVEKAVGRKAGNAVACEGRERVERCEVFGKWRARMGMAGFKGRPVARGVVESMRANLTSPARGGNPNYTVKEENGGVCFGWMGRTLTVASAWR